jgi:hypothetical protein
MRQFKRLADAKGFLYSIAVALIPSASAMVLAFTPGQAMALPSQEPQHQEPKPDQPNNTPSQQPDTAQEDANAVVVTGTIVKSGSDFVLKDSSGTVYNLDAPDKAEPYNGKSVKVTGKLEADTNLLPVESIEAITA